MNDTFDQLAKGLAQSVTRRGALKKFGLGLAGIALASLGVANKSHADPGCLPSGRKCSNPSSCQSKCCSGNFESFHVDGYWKVVYVCA
jgi:hypothetical protein